MMGKGARVVKSGGGLATRMNTVPVTSKLTLGMVFNQKIEHFRQRMNLMEKDAGNDLMETFCGVVLQQYFGGSIGSLRV